MPFVKRLFKVFHSSFCAKISFWAICDYKVLDILFQELVIGQTYSTNDFDFTFNSFSFADTISDLYNTATPKDNCRFLVIDCAVNNRSPYEISYIGQGYFENLSKSGDSIIPIQFNAVYDEKYNFKDVDEVLKKGGSDWDLPVLVAADLLYGINVASAAANGTEPFVVHVMLGEAGNYQEYQYVVRSSEAALEPDGSGTGDTTGTDDTANAMFERGAAIDTPEHLPPLKSKNS
jgi:hypothetical protein